MTVAKMNDGVALLLERMKTNPEEFTPQYDGGTTKWGNVIGQYRTYLTAEDNKTLDDAWKETVTLAMRQKFTEKVLEELVNPKLVTNPQITNGGFTLTASNATGAWDNRAAIGTTSGTTTISTSSYLDAQRYQTEQMRIQLDAQREVMKRYETQDPIWKTI